MIILTHEILEQVTDNNAFIILVKSIAKRASFDTNQSCFPGTSLMCKDTGLSRSSVIRARKWLETNGFIKIVKKGKTKDGQYPVNEYSIKTNLIKVVGNLKSDGVVSEVDGGSVTENLPSVTDELGVVSQMNSNLKSNITSSPINEGSFNEEGTTPKHREEGTPPDSTLTDTQRKRQLFDEWWTLYDKKVGRAKVEPKFHELSFGTIQKIIEVTPAYVASKPNKYFRKNPATFLNQKAWEDEIIDPEQEQQDSDYEHYVEIPPPPKGFVPDPNNDF